MAILRIEHPVADYATWKHAFDGDPVDRKGSGVRRYRVMRQVDDPNYVVIDLEFDAPEAAAAMLSSMRDVWGRVAGTLITNPQARIVEPVEAVEY